MLSFEEEYQEQSTDIIQAYDRVQADYAGAQCDHKLESAPSRTVWSS